MNGKPLYLKQPEVPCIYALWQGKRLLYIGQTQNLRQRLRSHYKWMRHRGLLGVTATYEICEGDPAVRRYKESRLILAHRPPLNSGWKR